MAGAFVLNSWGREFCMFDVVIAGAGPAGGHLARLLAGQGRSVLLVDAIPDWHHNPFSSAGLPLEALDRWGLPHGLVKARWKGLEIVSTAERGSWAGDRDRGAVLDFGELRAFLGEEARTRGAELRLGTRLTGWEALPEGGCRVKLASKDGNEEVQARVLVDATGPARAAFGLRPGTDYLYGVGLEHLVEVDEATYQRFGDRLVFYLGKGWVPGGYGWIFPMGQGRLKVGAGVFTVGRGRQSPDLGPFVERLLREEVRAGSRTLDIHGGLLRYARGLGDHYATGPVIAIGDAVSTLNVLGGEGIRFAMEGAELALPFIEAELAQPGSAFRGYERAMKKRFLRSWNHCEALAIRKYLEEDDSRFDRMVRFLKQQEMDLLMEVLFDYRFGRALRAAGPRYLLGKLWRKLRRPLGRVPPC